MQRVANICRLNRNQFSGRVLQAYGELPSQQLVNGDRQVTSVPLRSLGNQSVTSEEERLQNQKNGGLGNESIQQKSDSQSNIKEIEKQIQKYAVSGQELKNVAINFSIIKQNEFRSLIKVGDIGAEELEFKQVQNLERTQDQQIKLSDHDRSQRSIFIEEINQHIPNHQFSEKYAVQYCEQIFQAFPEKEVQRKMEQIMQMDELLDRKSDSKKQVAAKSGKKNQKEAVLQQQEQESGQKDAAKDAILDLQVQGAQKKTPQGSAADLVEQIKVENRSFEDQQQIRKVLLTEAGQDSASGSDRESDVEEITEATFDAARKEGDQIGEYSKRQNRIFQHIQIMDKNVALPARTGNDELKMTLFIEPDDFLLHTFICNENFGYLSNPASKDPEFEFFISEIRQPVLVYMRDYWQEFMEFLKENDEYFEPVIYTSGLKPYTDRILNILDPEREVFKYHLHQNACYIFEVKEENILFLIKDISRFGNRNIKRSILLDSKAQNYMMTPENCIPVGEYTAESVDPKQLEGYSGNVDPTKDTFLLELIDELDQYKDLEDIRPVIHKKYNIRQLLKNSKLI